MPHPEHTTQRTAHVRRDKEGALRVWQAVGDHGTSLGVNVENCDTPALVHDALHNGRADP
jgi:hypothetical protein